MYRSHSTKTRINRVWDRYQVLLPKGQLLDWINSTLTLGLCVREWQIEIERDKERVTCSHGSVALSRGDLDASAARSRAGTEGAPDSPGALHRRGVVLFGNAQTVLAVLRQRRKRERTRGSMKLYPPTWQHIYLLSRALTLIWEKLYGEVSGEEGKSKRGLAGWRTPRRHARVNEYITAHYRTIWCCSVNIAGTKMERFGASTCLSVISLVFLLLPSRAGSQDVTVKRRQVHAAISHGSQSYRLQTAFLGGAGTTNRFLCYFALLHHIGTPGIHFMAPTLSREIKTGKCSGNCGIKTQSSECNRWNCGYATNMALCRSHSFLFPLSDMNASTAVLITFNNNKNCCWMLQ